MVASRPDQGQAGRNAMKVRHTAEDSADGSNHNGSNSRYREQFPDGCLVGKMHLQLRLAAPPDGFGTDLSWASRWNEQPAELRMLSRCANPNCLNRFLRLGSGRLFLVEAEASAEAQTQTNDPSQPRFLVRGNGDRRNSDPRSKVRGVERYWLCEGCAKTWTLVHNAHEGVSLQLLRRVVGVGTIGATSGRTT